MSKSIDLIERLSSVSASAIERAEAETQTVARRAASVGMLDSGNRFLDHVKSFKSIFDEAAAKMAGLAVEVVAPKSAASLFRREARTLQACLCSHLEDVVDGKGSGIRLPAAGQENLRADFQRHTNQRIIDISNEITTGIITGRNGPVGFAAYVRRHFWGRFVPAAFGIATLILTYLKT